MYYRSILFFILFLRINWKKIFIEYLINAIWVGISVKFLKLWKIDKVLSLCLKLKLTNPLSLQPDGLNPTCSKLRLFDK